MQCIQEFNGFHGKVFILNVQITHCRLGNSLCLDWNCPTLCWSKIQEDSGWQENKKPAETTQRSSNWTEGLGAQLFSTGLLQRSLGAGQQENGTGKVHCEQTGSAVPELGQMLTGSALLTCAGNKREKAAQQILSHCLLASSPGQDTTWHQRAGQPVTRDANAGAFHVNILALHG